MIHRRTDCLNTEELPPTIFHTDDHLVTVADPDDDDDDEDDFVIISEDEGETVEPKCGGGNTNLDGWVLYRVSSATTTATAPGADDVSDSDSDIFILAGNEDGLESVPGRSL